MAIIATWSISLDCKCPSCEKQVNLLDEVDFWECRHLDLCEHGTDRSTGIDVTCPECGHDFDVDLEY